MARLLFALSLSCLAFVGNTIVLTVETLREQAVGEPQVLHKKATPLSSAAETCRCCWRDCEDDTAEQKHEEIMRRKEASEREGEVVNASEAGDVDAWIYFAGQGNYGGRNMYTPVIETVKYGLRDVVSNLKVIDSRSFDAMLDGLKVASAKGKRPLVLAVEFWWPHFSDIIGKLSQVHENGGYLVIYNTEPKRAPRCGRMAQQMKASEIWDYAMSNVIHYPKNGIPARYVPPGYAPALEYGVDFDSEDQNDPVKLGYMGSDRQKQPIYDKYRNMFGDHATFSNGIWTEADLKNFLNRYPLQLNMHKFQTCCPRDNAEKTWMHLESFRFSDLLSNKACVISPPGSDKDNEVWKSVVHIVDVEDTFAEFERLKNNVSACRHESYERFKLEFDAFQILNRTGFLNAWSPTMASSTS